MNHYLSLLLFVSIVGSINLISCAPQVTTAVAGAPPINGIDLVFDSSNNMYVVNFNPGNTIEKYIYSGGNFATTPTPFANADLVSSITIDKLNNLYVYEALPNSGSTCNGQISKISPSGIKTLYKAGFCDGNSIAYDSNTNIMYLSLSSSNKIVKILPSGVIQDLAVGGLIKWPTDIALDNYGRLYVANFVDTAPATVRQILKIDIKTGAVNVFASSTEFGQWIVVDSHGVIYNSNSDTRKILKISNTGLVSTYVESSGSPPFGLAIDQTKDLFIASNPAVLRVKECPCQYSNYCGADSCGRIGATSSCQCSAGKTCKGALYRYQCG